MCAFKNRIMNQFRNSTPVKMSFFILLFLNFFGNCILILCCAVIQNWLSIVMSQIKFIIENNTCFEKFENVAFKATLFFSFQIFYFNFIHHVLDKLIKKGMATQKMMTAHKMFFLTVFRDVPN